jgi:hypothetical protein
VEKNPDLSMFKSQTGKPNTQRIFGVHNRSPYVKDGIKGTALATAGSGPTTTRTGPSDRTCNQNPGKFQFRLRQNRPEQEKEEP